MEVGVDPVDFLAIEVEDVDSFFGIEFVDVVTGFGEELEVDGLCEFGVELCFDSVALSIDFCFAASF